MPSESVGDSYAHAGAVWRLGTKPSTRWGLSTLWQGLGAEGREQGAALGSVDTQSHVRPRVLGSDIRLGYHPHTGSSRPNLPQYALASIGPDSRGIRGISYIG